MSDDGVVWTGGCQCGAVRFRVTGLQHPSVCYCRMCQKAFGSIGGPLVTVTGLTWTRGEPARFKSSNIAQRGFCEKCGTPLTFESSDGVEMAIGAFDAPSVIEPEHQLARRSAPAWVDRLAGLPNRPREAAAQAAARHPHIESYQHPDHDTESWPNSEVAKS